MLTTLHGAKGLEFPVCFMIGLEEELLPHARTLNPQATDVDRSRPRHRHQRGAPAVLRRDHARPAQAVPDAGVQRVTRGRSVPRTPSRFLLEIPDELLEVRDLGDEAAQKVPEAEVQSFFANLAATIED